MPPLPFPFSSQPQTPPRIEELRSEHEMIWVDPRLLRDASLPYRWRVRSQLLAMQYYWGWIREVMLS